VAGSDKSDLRDVEDVMLQVLAAEMRRTAGLPDLSWYIIPKQEKMYQMTTKCSFQIVNNIPHVCKILQMAVNLSTISKLRPSKIYPNRDFWFENNSSGNPGEQFDVLITVGKSGANPPIVSYKPPAL
jgi:hypothetical protein